MFPEIGNKMVDVTYDPDGCETVLNSVNCRATYTCTDNNREAECNCSRNDGTGSIACSSDSVTSVIDTCRERDPGLQPHGIILQPQR